MSVELLLVLLLFLRGGLLGGNVLGSNRLFLSGSGLLGELCAALRAKRVVALGLSAACCAGHFLTEVVEQQVDLGQLFVELIDLLDLSVEQGCVCSQPSSFRKPSDPASQSAP